MSQRLHVPFRHQWGHILLPLPGHDSQVYFVFLTPLRSRHLQNADASGHSLQNCFTLSRKRHGTGRRWAPAKRRRRAVVTHLPCSQMPDASGHCLHRSFRLPRKRERHDMPVERGSNRRCHVRTARHRWYMRHAHATCDRQDGTMRTGTSEKARRAVAPVYARTLPQAHTHAHTHTHTHTHTHPPTQHIEWTQRPREATWRTELDGNKSKYTNTKRHDFTVRLQCESGEESCAADGDLITTVVQLRSPQNSCSRR